jgi:hypothetical protein
MNRDFLNGIDTKVALAPVVVTDNTVQTGIAIDTRDVAAVTFVVATGTIADVDATFAVKIEESDVSGSGYTDTAAGDYVGTTALASFTFAADILTLKLGYRGRKRYARIVITPTNNAGNAPLSAIAILDPLRRPAPNPPV